MFASCDRGNKFTVEGTLNSAGGDTLYLEHRDLAGLELIDSVILKDNGAFKFKHPASQNPEFYQLRLGKQVVAFAVDSTETLRVTADASDLYKTFIVSFFLSLYTCFAVFTGSARIGSPSNAT